MTPIYTLIQPIPIDKIIKFYKNVEEKKTVTLHARIVYTSTSNGVDNELDVALSKYFANFNIDLLLNLFAAAQTCSKHGDRCNNK